MSDKEWHLPNWIIIISFLVLLSLGLGLVSLMALHQHESSAFYAEFGVWPDNKSSEAQEVVIGRIEQLCKNALETDWRRSRLLLQDESESYYLKLEKFHKQVRDAFLRLDYARALIRGVEYPITDPGCSGWDPPKEEE